MSPANAGQPYGGATGGGFDGANRMRYGSPMSTQQCLALVLGCLVFAGGVEAAGVLDRLKRKLDETQSELQEARNDVEAVSRTDDRVEAVADGAIPGAGEVENRATVELERTETVQGVRELQNDTNAVATADDRAKTAVDGEMSAAQREVEATLDVESRARRELDATEAAAAAREAESAVNTVLTADERAESELERQRAEIERAAKFE